MKHQSFLVMGRISIITILALIMPLLAYGQDPMPDDTARVFGSAIGVDITLTNSGFGVGGHGYYTVSPTSSTVIEMKIVPAKDGREATFFNRFGGRDIPHKLNYLIKVPLRVGIHQRLFATQIEDNFRPHLYMTAGPTLGWVYPYFDDVNENQRLDEEEERVFSTLEALPRGEAHWGMGMSIMLGAHFGTDESTLRSVRIGYTVDYFFEPQQLLEPHVREAQQVFGTPTITLSFGRLL